MQVYKYSINLQLWRQDSSEMPVSIVNSRYFVYRVLVDLK